MFTEKGEGGERRKSKREKGIEKEKERGVDGEADGEEDMEKERREGGVCEEGEGNR